MKTFPIPGKLMNKFNILDHTADAAIEVYGKDLSELFEHSASGMFSLIIDIETIKPDIKQNYSFNNSNLEELLNNWLNELLYVFESDKILFKEFKVKISKKENNFFLNGTASGEKYDPDKHIIYSDIKMVTFHQLEIKTINNNLTTKIIFDL
jgi:SHS2 domain-containing protein